MTRIGIIANAVKVTIVSALATLNTIPDLKIIFCKESIKKRYVIWFCRNLIYNIILYTKITANSISLFFSWLEVCSIEQNW